MLAANDVVKVNHGGVAEATVGTGQGGFVFLPLYAVLFLVGTDPLLGQFLVSLVPAP